MSKLTDLWLQINNKRPNGLTQTKWRRSYIAVSSMIQLLGIVMITTQEEFDNLAIPEHASGCLSYNQRKIVISENNIVLKPITIDRIFSHYVQKKRKCIKCHLIKNITEFYIGFSSCKECHRSYQRTKIDTNVDTFFHRLYYSAKNRSIIRTKNGREIAGKFTILLQDIKDVYKKQNEKCYYTKLPFSFKRHSDWRCSLERINPSKGYIKKNIALIISEFQGASQWNLQKINELIDLLFIKHKKNYYIETVQKVQVSRQRIISTSIDCKCNKCGIVKSLDKFYKILGRGCRECNQKLHKIYLETLIGHMNKRLEGMISHSKKRNHIPPELNVNDLLNIFNQQNGLCAYSGIPMTWGSYLKKSWTCSPERKYTSIGYTKDNVYLVCFEFNTTDLTSNAIDPHEVTRSGAWSKKKMDYLKEHFILSTIDEIIEDIRSLFN